MGDGLSEERVSLEDMAIKARSTPTLSQETSAVAQSVGLVPDQLQASLAQARQIYDRGMQPQPVVSPETVRFNQSLRAVDIIARLNQGGLDAQEEVSLKQELASIREAEGQQLVAAVAQRAGVENPVQAATQLKEDEQTASQVVRPEGVLSLDILRFPGQVELSRYIEGQIRSRRRDIADVTTKDIADLAESVRSCEAGGVSEADKERLSNEIRAKLLLEAAVYCAGEKKWKEFDSFMDRFRTDSELWETIQTEILRPQDRRVIQEMESTTPAPLDLMNPALPSLVIPGAPGVPGIAFTGQGRGIYFRLHGSETNPATAKGLVYERYIRLLASSAGAANPAVLSASERAQAEEKMRVIKQLFVVSGMYSYYISPEDPQNPGNLWEDRLLLGTAGRVLARVAPALSYWITKRQERITRERTGNALTFIAEPNDQIGRVNEAAKNLRRLFWAPEFLHATARVKSLEHAAELYVVPLPVLAGAGASLDSFIYGGTDRDASDYADIIQSAGEALSEAQKMLAAPVVGGAKAGELDSLDKSYANPLGFIDKLAGHLRQFGPVLQMAAPAVLESVVNFVNNDHRERTQYFRDLQKTGPQGKMTLVATLIAKGYAEPGQREAILEEMGSRGLDNALKVAHGVQFASGIGMTLLEIILGVFGIKLPKPQQK